jgi:hypothetical protein
VKVNTHERKTLITQLQRQASYFSCVVGKNRVSCVKISVGDNNFKTDSEESNLISDFARYSHYWKRRIRSTDLGELGTKAKKEKVIIDISQCKCFDTIISCTNTNTNTNK